MEYSLGEGAKPQIPPPIHQPAKRVRPRNIERNGDDSAIAAIMSLAEVSPVGCSRNSATGSPSGPGDCVARCQKTGKAGTESAPQKKSFELKNCILLLSLLAQSTGYTFCSFHPSVRGIIFGGRLNLDWDSERGHIFPVVFCTVACAWPEQDAQTFVEPQAISFRLLPNPDLMKFVGIRHFVFLP